jgi:hypothetical protein
VSDPSSPFFFIMSQRKAVIDRQAAAMKIEDYGSMELEHLHWCSVCGSGLKILDEEQEWIHWKTAVTLEKCTVFRALEQSNIYSQFVFIDYS